MFQPLYTNVVYAAGLTIDCGAVVLVHARVIRSVATSLNASNATESALTTLLNHTANDFQLVCARATCDEEPIGSVVQAYVIMFPCRSAFLRQSYY